MGRNKKAGLSLAATIVLVVGTTLLWRPLGDPHAAFAAAIQRLASARTVTYKLTVPSSQLKRVIRTGPNGEKMEDDTVQSAPSTTTFQVMRMEPNLERRVKENGTVTILDWTARRSLTLTPWKQAIATPIDATGTPPSVLEQVRTLETRAAERLDKAQIDGREAIGFKTAAGSTQWVVWVDPATNLPIRIEATGGTLGQGKQILSDFAFDVPLDESLFSLTPPPDHTVSQQKGRDQLLIESLEAYAGIMDGAFPESLPIGLAPVIKKYREANPDVSKDEVIQIQNKLAGAAMFSAMLPKDADWHYAGKGVKRGTPNTAIFWYKTAGSVKYRVIYADLTVNELGAEALPAQ